MINKRHQYKHDKQKTFLVSPHRHLHSRSQSCHINIQFLLPDQDDAKDWLKVSQFPVLKGVFDVTENVNSVLHNPYNIIPCQYN